MGEAEVWLHSFLTLAVAGGEGKNPVPSVVHRAGLDGSNREIYLAN
jgi:hypothetical protein